MGLFGSEDAHGQGRRRMRAYLGFYPNGYCRLPQLCRPFDLSSFVGSFRGSHHDMFHDDGINVVSRVFPMLPSTVAHIWLNVAQVRAIGTTF